jgi:hypothetical protein
MNVSLERTSFIKNLMTHYPKRQEGMDIAQEKEQIAIDFNECRVSFGKFKRL